MNHIDKALEQMTRGMSSEQGRQEVNAETLAERVKYQDEWIERQKSLKLAKSAKPVQDTGKLIQDGHFGRLD